MINNQSPQKLYYRIESIGNILGDDVTQHIASFVDHREIKQINKKFKKYAIRNEALRMQKWIRTKVGSNEELSEMYQIKLEYINLHFQEKENRKIMQSLQLATSAVVARSERLELKIRRRSDVLSSFYQSQPVQNVSDQDSNRLFAPNEVIKYNRECNDVWLVDDPFEYGYLYRSKSKVICYYVFMIASSPHQEGNM